MLITASIFLSVIRIRMAHVAIYLIYNSNLAGLQESLLFRLSLHTTYSYPTSLRHRLSIDF